MPRYDLILFDMDGTIANTDDVIVESFNELYDLYRGGKRTPLEQIYYFSGPPLRETLPKEFPDMDYDFIYQEFYRISGSKYDTMVKGYPYSREVKLKLKEEGIKLGVVTNKAHNLAVHCLETIHLDDVMDVLIGVGDVKNNKPDPEGILKAMEIVGIKDKKKVLYVGDNYIDYLSAKNAGVDSCLVTWGPREVSKEAKPTYKISDYRELLEVIK